MLTYGVYCRDAEAAAINGSVAAAFVRKDGLNL